MYDARGIGPGVAREGGGKVVRGSRELGKHTRSCGFFRRYLLSDFELEYDCALVSACQRIDFGQSIENDHVIPLILWPLNRQTTDIS